MKTIEEIKNDLLAQNHSKIYTFNDQEFEMTQGDFDKAIQDRAEMEYTQQVYLEELKNVKLNKISGYHKLGLANAEIIAIMNLTPDEALDFGL
jgi:hypothetical protein